ncbi:hypothetical protein T11_4172, partial [Trichinella zimbabwensis]
LHHFSEFDDANERDKVPVELTVHIAEQRIFAVNSVGTKASVEMKILVASVEQASSIEDAISENRDDSKTNVLLHHCWKGGLCFCVFSCHSCLRFQCWQISNRTSEAMTMVMQNSRRTNYPHPPHQREMMLVTNELTCCGRVAPSIAPAAPVTTVGGWWCIDRQFLVSSYGAIALSLAACSAAQRCACSFSSRPTNTTVRVGLLACLPALLACFVIASSEFRRMAASEAAMLIGQFCYATLDSSRQDVGIAECDSNSATPHPASSNAALFVTIVFHRLHQFCSTCLLFRQKRQFYYLNFFLPFPNVVCLAGLLPGTIVHQMEET